MPKIGQGKVLSVYWQNYICKKNKFLIIFLEFFFWICDQIAVVSEERLDIDMSWRRFLV